MFSNLLKGSTKRRRPLEVTKEAIDAPPPRQINHPGHDAKGQRSASRLSPRPPAQHANHAHKTLASQERLVRRARSSSSAIDFGTEGSDSEDSSRPTKSKRVRLSYSGRTSRNVRSQDPGEFNGAGAEQVVHAAEICALDKTTKYESLFSAPVETEVKVQYPSYWPSERFALIRPSHDDSAFNAFTEVLTIMQSVSEFFVPEEAQTRFDDEIDGYIQRLKRATKRRSLPDLNRVIAEYNAAVLEMLHAKNLGKQLDQSDRVPARLVEHILNQTYTRTVSPNLKSLRVYEAGTDNVYGELLPRFVSDILTKDVDIAPDQVFVDLGSGVGNVVLQAALQIGCESWGCEMMEHSCDLADRQLAEFTARCRMWGLSIGPVHLERGDFLANDTIKGVLRRADVVLVNNQVFTPALNEALTTLFLDLKDGCFVVSLKSFVPTGYKITERNSENPLNLLSVQAKQYFSNCVSWTSQGGSYFVSKKDSRRLERFRRASKPPLDETATPIA